MTPLHAALHCPKPERISAMLTLLLEASADPAATHVYPLRQGCMIQLTGLGSAVVAAHQGLLEHCIAIGWPPDPSALVMAAHLGKQHEVELLLKAGSDKSVPVELYTIERSMAFMPVAVAAGAQIDTPLHNNWGKATRSALVSLLKTDEFNPTALRAAIRVGDQQSVAILIQDAAKGVVPGVHCEAVEMLRHDDLELANLVWPVLDQGLVQLNDAPDNGWCQCAVGRNAKSLARFTGCSCPVCSRCSKSGRCNSCQGTIATGLRITSSAADHEAVEPGSWVQWCCAYNCQPTTNILEFLLKHDADPDKRGSPSQKSALALAARRSLDHSVQCLLAAGATVDLSALHCAVRCPRPSSDIFKLLLEQLPPHEEIAVEDLLRATLECYCSLSECAKRGEQVLATLTLLSLIRAAGPDPRVSGAQCSSTESGSHKQVSSTATTVCNG